MLTSLIVISLLASADGNSQINPHGNRLTDGEIIGIELGRAPNSGGIRLRGQQVTRLVAFGRKEDLARFVGNSALIRFSSCECLLLPPPLGDCVVTGAPRVQVPLRFTHLTPGTVVAVVQNSSEFVRAFNATRQQVGTRERGPGGSVSVPVGGGGSRRCEGGSGCKPTGEVTVDTEGVASFSAGCEDGLMVEVTTEGDVNVSVSRGSVTMSVPVRSHSR